LVESRVGRESGRSTQLIRGILASTLNRGLTALAPILTVPVSLHYLGAAGYGAWSAALALTGLATFADLGIGSGLMTRLPAAIARDVSSARRMVSSAYLALAALVALLIAALWLSSFFVDWAYVTGGVAAGRDPDVALITLVALSGFLFNIVAMLIVRVQYAAQQVALSNLWQGTAVLIGIVATFGAAALAPGRPAFVAIAAFTPGVISVVNAVWFFSTRRGRRLRPAPSQFAIAEARDLASIGIRFMLIGILTAGSLGIDTWIVAHTTSLSAVPEYSIPARVFALIGTGVSILTVPLWPAHSAAIAAGDVTWVWRTTRRMTWLTPTLVGGLSVVAVLVAQPLLELWLGPAIHPSIILLAGLAAWNVVQAVVGPIFMVQNAVGVLGPQTIAYALLLLVVPIKWWVASSVSFELLPMVSAASYVALVWPAALIGYRRSMAMMKAVKG
jgi:O-antigen/teichoic acid export membrane protein